MYPASAIIIIQWLILPHPYFYFPHFPMLFWSIPKYYLIHKHSSMYLLKIFFFLIYRDWDFSSISFFPSHLVYKIGWFGLLNLPQCKFCWLASWYRWVCFSEVYSTFILVIGYRGLIIFRFYFLGEILSSSIRRYIPFVFFFCYVSSCWWSVSRTYYFIVVF